MYSQNKRNGVRMDVNNKPRGRYSELKKKYNMAKGKYLLIFIGLAIDSNDLPLLSGLNYAICLHEKPVFPMTGLELFKICSSLR